MKTYEMHQTITTYTFSELNDQAKENVKNWYLNGQEPELFSEICKAQLGQDFPNSDLNVQYSLSYCQGDGLNVYGSIKPTDLLEYLKNHAEYNDKFTDKDIKAISLYAYYMDEIILPENRRYCYCIADQIEFAKEWIYDLKEFEHMRDIRKKAIEKLESVTKQIFKDICTKLEKKGYSYFYEVAESELNEICETNQYEFLIDGTLFC